MVVITEADPTESTPCPATRVPIMLASIGLMPRLVVVGRAQPARSISQTLARLLMILVAVPKVVLWAFFQSWSATVLTCEFLAAENDLLREKLGRRKESIWHMKKAELVEKAVEMGLLPPREAQQETVAQLRLLLRECLAASAGSEEELLPKGLASMKHADLVQWCMAHLCEESKGCLYPFSREGGAEKPKTREKLIHSIRAWCHHKHPSKYPPPVGQKVDRHLASSSGAVTTRPSGTMETEVAGGSSSSGLLPSRRVGANFLGRLSGAVPASAP